MKKLKLKMIKCTKCDGDMPELRLTSMVTNIVLIVVQ